MPICPKCGKSFSSDQALGYHLNKKYKCGTWKCETCNTIFDTKHKLKLHLMHCEQDFQYSDLPSIDILAKIYNKSNLAIYQVDKTGVINGVNPCVEKNYGYNRKELLGSNMNKYINKMADELYHSTKSGDMVQVKKEIIDDSIVIFFEI